jgi:hypothetical protein
VCGGLAGDVLGRKQLMPILIIPGAIGSLIDTASAPWNTTNVSHTPPIIKINMPPYAYKMAIVKKYSIPVCKF